MPTREIFRRARPAWAALHLTAALSLAACEDFSGPRPGDGTLPRASWTRPAPGDGSPHREGFVRRDGVALHYLDWGGSGPALLLVAGRGENAHVFDDLAPRLAPRYRVVAVTRRGYGQSGRPAAGFDVNALVDDDVAVLDRLGIRRAYLAGHSIASHEITRLAVRHPARVARVVYLDGSLNDPAGRAECAAAPSLGARRGMTPGAPGATDPAPLDPFSAPPAGDGDVASFAAYARYARGTMPAPWSPALESNLWHAVSLDRDGHVLAPSTSDATDALMGRGICAYRPEFAAVRAPMLAVVAMPGAATDLWPWAPSLDPATAATLDGLVPLVRAGQAANLAGFVAEAPAARTLVVEQSNHYVFVRHQERVLAALRDFLPATMPE